MSTKIMLADLLYDNDRGPSYFLAPLNIGYITAYAKKLYGDKCDIRIYRNVDQFIKDFQEDPPEIVGFGQYIWNHDLTQNVLKWIKHTRPNTISFAGGPMVGSTEEDAAVFMELNPLIDFCVSVYGEYGFSQFFQRYIDCDGDVSKMKEDMILGVSFSTDGTRSGNVYSIVNQLTVKPIDIPSPYLTGLMDPFLEEGYSPIIQCMRGCPYTCTYCFAAKLDIGQFTTETVLAEIDYIYERTKSSALAVTDDNFGLYSRDIEIAKRIRSNYDQFGYPSKMLLYYSKKPTETVIEISKIMRKLAPFFISYQSRNPETLKTIERYNLIDENTIKIVKICKEYDIHVASEMIFGLPHETKQTFMEGLEELYGFNIDTLAIYNCKFFNGTDIATKASISSHKLKTKHRLYEDNFAIYKTNDPYKEIIACETDEIPVESDSFNYQDFIDIRILGFWIEMCFSKKMYYEVLKHLENYGISPFRLIYSALDGKFKMPEKIKDIFTEIQKGYEDELFDSFDELKEHMYANIKKNSNYKSKKINLYYCYMVIHTDIREDFDTFIKDATILLGKENLDPELYEEFLKPLDDLFRYHHQRCVNLSAFKREYTSKDIQVIETTLDENGAVGEEMNQGSETAQRYLLEGTRASQTIHGGTDEEISKRSKIESNYSEIGEYQYDFVAWEKDYFRNPISHYNSSKDGSYKIRFMTRNPKQYKVLMNIINTMDESKIPFMWHNYIYSNNVKSYAETINPTVSLSKEEETLIVS